MTEDSGGGNQEAPNVETIFELTKTTTDTSNVEKKISRKINPTLINDKDIHSVKRLADRGDLCGAASKMEQIIKEATAPIIKSIRRSKPWFNKECYTARKVAMDALHLLRANSSEINLQDYRNKRRKYKDVMKETKKLFQEKEERKVIEEAERNPYKALNPRQPKFPQNIPMETCEKHLISVLQERETRPMVFQS